MAYEQGYLEPMPDFVRGINWGEAGANLRRKGKLVNNPGGTGGGFPLPAEGGVATPGVPAGIGTALTGGAAAPLAFGSTGASGFLQLLNELKGNRSWLDVLGDVGQLLGGAAANRAGGRQAESLLALSRDRTRADIYGTQQRASSEASALGERGKLDRADLDLRRRAYQLRAPSARGGQAAYGDLLANVQDVGIEAPAGITPVKFTGGLRPSVLSEGTRQLGRELSSSALAGQLAGDQFADIPETDFQAAQLPTPPEIDLPQPGGTDSFLNSASLVASILAALQKPEAQQSRAGEYAYNPPPRRYA